MKVLYRVDEVAEMLSMSKRSVYYLLDQGELEGHNDSPGKRGLRVTGESILRYVERYKIRVEGISDEAFHRPVRVRKVISKGVE
jgi:excisionase family DNA binding protein